MSRFKPKLWEWDCGRYGGKFTIRKIENGQYRVNWSTITKLTNNMDQIKVKRIQTLHIRGNNKSDITGGIILNSFEECISWCKEALTKIKEVLDG